MCALAGTRRAVPSTLTQAQQPSQLQSGMARLQAVKKMPSAAECWLPTGSTSTQKRKAQCTNPNAAHGATLAAINFHALPNPA